jgi:DNA-binding NarL/FixJ family response regulator
LSDADFDDAWADGQRFSLDQAIVAAIRLTEELAIDARPASPCHLTRREQDVLYLLCLHLTDPEIAQRLCLSPRTASNHVARILRKLGASNRREAAILAASHGLT